jgi:hypothetical protein
LWKLILNRNVLPSGNFWTELDAWVAQKYGDFKMEVKTPKCNKLVVTPVGLATFLAVCDFLTKWER